MQYLKAVWHHGTVFLCKEKLLLLPDLAGVSCRILTQARCTVLSLSCKSTWEEHLLCKEALVLKVGHWRAPFPGVIVDRGQT